MKEFSGFRKAAERKLTMRDNASDIKDLLSPPGSRLDRLTGDRSGQRGSVMTGRSACVFK